MKPVDVTNMAYRKHEVICFTFQFFKTVFQVQATFPEVSFLLHQLSDLVLQVSLLFT